MASMRTIVFVLLLLPATAAAQSSAKPASAPESPLPQAASTHQAPGAALEPQGFDYDPHGRRDPFVSLLRRGSDTPRSAANSRPPGLAGLEASEVTLKGTLQSRDGYVAMLQGVDGKTYIVRPGDRLLDGTIRSITQTVLVIVQQMQDPLSRERQREVRKTIRQTDEAK
jgi:Tfp pilus assembly protein PilP